MGSINLYQIEEVKRRSFVQEIKKEYKKIGNTKTISQQVDNIDIVFSLTLYLARPQKIKDLSWNWLLTEFDTLESKSRILPKAVLLVEKHDSIYAITFGHSYFMVDKFCDRDFGFNFARKLKYKEVKTTTLISPHSRRNKTINSYLYYEELEFDSGESYAKLKAKADLPDDFITFKPTLEFGNSIKFSIENDSLDKIVCLIIYVEKTLRTQEDLHRIPVFSIIKDTDLLNQLNIQLSSNIRQNPAQINVAELDIIGATEIFNRNDYEFTIKYEGKEKAVSALNYDEIETFCNEHGFDIAEILLDISVVSYQDGSVCRTDKIKNLIDYTNDSSRCLLSKGQWYKYNNDYMQYLVESLSGIKVLYNPKYDFLSEHYDAFIAEKYLSEKGNKEYQGKSKDEIITALKRKYYAEKSFNLIREMHDGFQNFDRYTQRIGSAEIEPMDLYKDRTMFAVKIGSTSAKLCYVIDQSLTSLKMYKRGQLKIHNNEIIDMVALWLILERKKHLKLKNGMPDINDLDMLMLKNRIDQWKKEVLLSGLKPCIYINYCSKAKD